MTSAATIRHNIKHLSPADRGLSDLARWSSDADVNEHVLSIYCAPAFLELRIQESGGAADLMQDFQLLAQSAPEGRQYQQVANALGLSAEIIQRDPTQLPVQLRARIKRPEGEFVRTLLHNFSIEQPHALDPVRTGLLLAERRFFHHRITSARLLAVVSSPTDPLLAVVDSEQHVLLVDVLEFQFRIIAAFSLTGARSVSFTPSGQRLLVGSVTCRVWIVEVKSRTKVAELTVAAQGDVIGCLDEERLVFMAGNRISVLSLTDGHELVAVGVPELASGVSSIAVDAVHDEVLTGCRNGRVDRWSGRSGRHVARVGWFGAYEEGWETSLSDLLIHQHVKGKLWATGADRTEALDFEQTLAELPGLSDLQRAQLRREISQDPLRWRVEAILVCAEGNVVLACANNTLRVWDRTSGKRLGSLLLAAQSSPTIVLDEQRKLLLVAQNQSIQLWQWPTLECVGHVPLLGARPLGLCCPTGARTTIVVSENGTLAAVDVDSAIQGAPKTHAEEPVSEIGCVMTEQLAWAISATGRIEEWDLGSGSRLRTFLPTERHRGQTRLCASGRRAVTSVPGGLIVKNLAIPLAMYRAEIPDSDHGEQAIELAVDDSGSRVVLVRSPAATGPLPWAQHLEFLLFDMPHARHHVLDRLNGQIDRLSISRTGRYAVLSRFLSPPPGEEPPDAEQKIVRVVQVWNLHEQARIREWEMDSTSILGGFVFDARDRRLLWTVNSVLYEMRLEDPAEPFSERAIASPWRDFSISSDDRFVSARIGSRIEVRGFEEGLSLRAAFDADYEFRSLRLSVQHGVLIACDVRGSIYILRCPLPAATVAVLDEDTTPAGRPEGRFLPAQLDRIAGLEGRGATADSSADLADLATYRACPTIFQIAVARLLYASGLTQVASQILQVVLTNAQSEDMVECVELLTEARDEAASIAAFSMLNDARAAQDEGLAGALARSADAWADAAHVNLLRSIASNAQSGFGRFLAAKALAGRDADAARQVFVELLEGASSSDMLRIVVWLSLRPVSSPTGWLQRFKQITGSDAWTERVRTYVAWQILGAFYSVVRIRDVEPRATARVLPIEPLRSALDCDQAAIELAQCGSIPEAIESSTQAIRLCPTGARYYYTRGMILIQQAQRAPDDTHTDLQRARADFSHAIDIDPDFDAAWSQRGYTYLQLEEYELAVGDIRRAIKLEDGHATDFQNLASALSGLGRISDAATAADHARALGVSDSSELRVGDARRARRGDAPEMTNTERSEALLIAREVLDTLGVLVPLRQHLAALARSASEEHIRATCIRMVEDLSGKTELEQLVADQAVSTSTRLAVAAAAFKNNSNETARHTLLSIVVDPHQSRDLRIRACRTILEANDVSLEMELLRQLRDVELPRDGQVPDGTLLAAEVLRYVLKKPGGADRVITFARDPSVGLEAREVASEAVGMIDVQLGSRLLEDLLAEAAEDEHVQDAIHHSLRMFAGKRDPRRTEGVRAAPHRPQAAFDDFCAAASPDEISTLAERHSVFRDPRFVEAVANLLPQIPEHERPNYLSKLEALKHLFPDAEAQLWRMFLQADSFESMGAAAQHGPTMTTAAFRAGVERMIQNTKDPLQAQALQRRLEWLRQQPANPLAEALEAFGAAADADQLARALLAHPVMTQMKFAHTVQRVLARHPDWPVFERRLQLLASLAGANSELQRLEDSFKSVERRDFGKVVESLEGTLGDSGAGTQMAHALALASDGRLAEAIERLSGIISHHPNAMAYAKRGEMLADLHRYREAVSDLTRALELDPDNSATWLQRGLAFARLHETQAAIRDYTQAETLGVKDFSLNFSRGVCYLQEGNLDRGIADLRASIEQTDDKCGAQLMLVDALIERGTDEEEARELLLTVRQSAAPEQLEYIDLLQARLDQRPASMNGMKLFKQLMLTSSTMDMLALMRREPLLSDPDVIRQIEEWGARNVPEEMKVAFEGRLASLRDIIEHSPQGAFEALMSAETLEEIHSVTASQPLLRDRKFLDHLAELAEQITNPQAKLRLSENLSKIARVDE